MIKVCRTLTYLILALIGAHSHAQQNPREERLAEFLKRMPASDANKDGKLTTDEWSAFMAKRNETLLKRFPQADTNRDGKLDRLELRAFTEKRKPVWQKP